MYLLLLLLGIQLLTGSAKEENCYTAEFVDISLSPGQSSSKACNQPTGAGWKGVLFHYAEDDHRQFVVQLKLSGKPYLVQRPDCVSEIGFYVNEVMVKSVITDIKNKNFVILNMPGKRCTKKEFMLKIKVFSLPYSKVDEKCHEASQKITYENLPEDCSEEIHEMPTEPSQKPRATSTAPKTLTNPGLEAEHSHNNVSTVDLIGAENTSSSLVPAIAGAAGGGLLLAIGGIALGVWLYKKGQRAGEAKQMERERQKDAEQLEMNKETNDVYGTYGECGEGDYNIVEDNNPYYEAGD